LVNIGALLYVHELHGVVIAVWHIALGVHLLLILLVCEVLVVVLDLDVGVGLLDEVHDGRLGRLFIAIDLYLIGKLCLTHCGISQIAKVLPSPERGAHGTHGFGPVHSSLQTWPCFIWHSIIHSIIEGVVFIDCLLVFKLRTALRLLSFKAGVVIPIVHHTLLIAIDHCDILQIYVQIAIGAVLYPREVVAAIVHGIFQVHAHRYFLVLVLWKWTAILVYWALAIRRGTHLIRIFWLELLLLLGIGLLCQVPLDGASLIFYFVPRGHICELSLGLGVGHEFVADLGHQHIALRYGFGH